VTTVVYKDGVMASDSRIVEGGSIFPGKQQKVFKLPDGTLFGFCGEVSVALEMLAYMTDDDDEDNCPTWRGSDTQVIHVESPTKLWNYEGHAGVWIPCRTPYIAIGSGAPYAYGAMAAGRVSAAEAVKIAMKFDPNSGGPVRVVKL
jgi:20S proteasome alpha/beta subunit